MYQMTPALGDTSSLLRTWEEANAAYELRALDICLMTSPRADLRGCSWTSAMYTARGSSFAALMGHGRDVIRIVPLEVVAFIKIEGSSSDLCRAIARYKSLRSELFKKGGVL